MFLPSSGRDYGMMFIGLGVWIAILTLALYSKYERRNCNNPSAYLDGFLIISATALAPILCVETCKIMKESDGV
jgi:hypothetical protein